MSLEGLRAWIGEVERKLIKRTRVFLALTVIAIGIAGASVYLAIDARNDSVSESDVQELQRELEARIDEAAIGAAAVPQVAPEAEPAPDASTGGVAPGGASTGEGGSPSQSSADKAKLKELLEQAKKQGAEAEADQAGE